MAYSLDLGAWSSVFAVPTALVDRHLKLAGKEQLQAILWILRHGAEPFEPKDLAAAAGMTVDSAQDAIDYWVAQGLLADRDGDLTPLPQQGPASAQQLTLEPEPARSAVPAKARLPKPDALYLAKRAEESAEIRALMGEAQNLLGILSPAMTAVLLAAHDDYGLPSAVLVMLLQYTKNAGKANARYIDSVARDWAESGILTPDAADGKLRELDERKLAWGKVSAAAGLARRSPSKKEEDAAYRWVVQWHFDPEMLAAAYERCVDHTGKFSAAYLDKILTRWHETGIQTLQDLEKDEQARQNADRSQKTYNIEELEEMSFFDVTEDD